MHIPLSPLSQLPDVDRLPSYVAGGVLDYLADGYAVADYLNDQTVICYQCGDHFDDEREDGRDVAGAWTCHECVECYR